MRHSILLFFLAGFSPLVSASNIISVSPLTDRVLLIHFDDGEVHYPNDLIVDRLDVAAAQVPSNYIVNSSADPNYA
ncbi:MAG: hypothetical protein HRU12_16945, partial [Phaeodactylibacter sp.]|nr:hypothetical protein [Phaeodactylibacter sp.]